MQKQRIALTERGKSVRKFSVQISL